MCAQARPEGAAIGVGGCSAGPDWRGAFYFPLTRFAGRGADGPQFRPPPHSVAVLSFVLGRSGVPGNRLPQAGTAERCRRHAREGDGGEGDGGAYQYVESYAAWGDITHAVQWLKRAVELQEGGLLAVNTDLFLDPLRHTPGFDALVATIGLPT
jgi:hypothetical protein